MKHICLHKPGLLEFGEGPEPEGGDDLVLVRVHRVGICGTDIHAFHGRQPFFEYPRILGHELGVEVLEAPACSPLKAGDRCSVEPYLNNPKSQASRRGKTNCCEDLRVLGVHMDGGMLPYLALPAHKLHPSEQLNYEQLALVETLCIGAHAADRADIQRGDRVVILGAGPIGLSVLSFAADRTDYPVTVVDLSEARLDAAKAHHQNVQTLNASGAADLRDSLLELQQGDAPTVILDATGNTHSMHSTFELAAQGATIVFVGLFQGDVQFHDPLFHRKELTLKSSRNATAHDFKVVIEALETGRIQTERWLTHRIPFGELPTEFASVTSQPDLLKAIVTMD